jgi:DNA repair photolyase
MNFKPKEIYIHQDVQKNPITQRVLQYNVEWMQIPYEIVTGARGIHRKENFFDTIHAPNQAARNINSGRRILFLQHYTRTFVEREDARHNQDNAPNIYNQGDDVCYSVKLGRMCCFNCHYCYNYVVNQVWAEYSAYVNIEDMMQEMTEVANEKTGGKKTFFLGEQTDSFAIDPATQMTTELVPLIATLPNSQAEFRTKSADIDNLEGLDHQEKSIIAFSIAPQSVITATEGGTATLEDRIMAMKKCQDWGYPVKICLDPIIPLGDWRDEYLKMIEMLAEKLDVMKIHHYSMGVLRFNPELIPICKERFPESKIWDLPLDHYRAGKYTHPNDIRARIYLKIRNFMKALFPGVRYYYSMEHKDFVELLRLDESQ